MDLFQLIDEFGAAITARVLDTHPPLYQPGTNSLPLHKLKRKPMGRQADAIGAIVHSLRRQRSTLLVGEMGVGKTTIAASAAYLAGFERILVMCPPGLTKKWKREVEDTVPGAVAVIVRNITDLERLRTIERAPLFAILSRERAKLGYRWAPAVITRPLRIGGHIAVDHETGEVLRGLVCPRCDEQVLDPDGVPLDEGDLARKKTRCGSCGDALWQADGSGVRRVALSDYIRRHMRGFFSLVTIDEMHEGKAKGSAQGIAMGGLAQACSRSLALSGTLSAGYASSIFYLLQRFGALRQEFAYHEEQRFVSRYGILERIVSRDQDDDGFEDGRTSRRKGYRTRMRERAGIVPAALTHLLGQTVFLRLSDVAPALPPYEERVLLVDMDRTEGPGGLSQASGYRILFDTLRAALSDALSRGSKRLLAQYLQTLLSFPDACTRGETVVDSATDEVLVQVAPLPEDRLYPKEEALLDLIAKEKLLGRRVLVYVTHTGTRDVTPRLKSILESRGFRTAVLKADAVAPEKREEWIARRIEEGVDVVVTNPRLVQTGLDLICFSSIFFVEPEYSTVVSRQASRRSWRIGQTEPVTVHFMAYRGTIQTEALKLVAKKVQSSLAIEGELPEGGLTSFADDGDDMLMALARRIVEGAAGDDDAVEAAFAHAVTAQAEAEEFIGIDRAEPESTAPFDPPKRDAPVETVALDDFAGIRPRRRGRTQSAPSPTLFEWALGLLDEAGPAQVSRS